VQRDDGEEVVEVERDGAHLVAARRPGQPELNDSRVAVRGHELDLARLLRRARARCRERLVDLLAVARPSLACSSLF
jgi:hypothetical protein